MTDGTADVTYAELWRRANRLARHLQRMGVEPESRVGLCLDRTADAVTGMLGILQAGGAYVPLDPLYPRPRLAAMLEDSGARWAVTRQDLWAGLGLGGATPVCLDAEAREIARFSGDEPPSAAGSGNLAYVIFTSGSTGRAKGVAIEHRSAVAFLRWALAWFTPEELSGVLASTSFCFDLSVFEIFAPLSAGGRVVLARDALELPRLPGAAGVTLVNTVPSAMAELLRAGRLPAAVRTVNLAGEPLRSRLARAVYAAGAERLYNLYGPSEDTTYSTGALVPREGDRPPAIGEPITGTEAWVLGAAGEPVRDGATGELFLGGAGLARGYLGRPELTAERFVPDSSSGRPGSRLYRTGDLVRRATDGEIGGEIGGGIEYLGRADQQVKIRGFRVELGEIEAVLAAHPGAGDAAAALREGENGEDGDRRLVAWVEPVPGGDLTAAGLRRYLRDRLPAHMVPSFLVVLPSLPRLPNGKIDRAALPAPEGRAGSPVPYEAPRTPLEAEIAALWEELTGAAPVGRGDRFLEIGGHSLLAAQAASRLAARHGIDLPFHACLGAPTVAAWAGLVEELARDRRAASSPVSPITAVPRQGALPLSDAQRRLWLLDRLVPESPLYNLPEAVRLRGPLDRAALAGALTAVVARHAVLRTGFAVRDHEPVQVIAGCAELPLPLADLRHLPAAAREAAALAGAELAARAPFDLGTPPLLRAALFRLAAEDHLLVLVLHHVAADGWSLDVLFRDLAAGYAPPTRSSGQAGGSAEKRPHPRPLSRLPPTPPPGEGRLAANGSGRLPPLPVQYAEYAGWQLERLAGGGLDAALERRRQRFAAGTPELDLPADRPRPAAPTWRGITRRLTVEPAAAAALRRLARAEGATLFMACLAVFETLLSRVTGQESFAVGTPAAGRPHPDLAGLIGFFVNLVPLRADLAGDPTGRALLRRVRGEALDAYADQDVPFDRLVEALRAERGAGRLPLVQAVLAVEEETAERSLPGLTACRVDVETGTAKFDLTLYLTAAADGSLRGALEANADLFAPAAVEALAGRFARLVTAFTAEPDRPVGELPILAEDERRRLLVDRNRTETAGDRRPVHAQIAAVAADAPESIAVVDGESVVTYRELYSRACALARRLRRMGAGPEKLVAVLAERSVDMVAGQLAALLAGGAFLPLDPELPPERLGFLVTDSRAGVLLAQERLLTRLPGVAVPVLCLDTCGSPETGGLTAGLESSGDPEGLAYVIYTSGSTGEPKGVAVRHAGLSNLVAWHRRVHGAGPGDRVSSLAGLSFDAAVWELWPALASGARVALAPEAVRLAPARLLEWLAAEEIDVAFLPTPLAEAALGEAMPAGLRLRTLLTGGDVLHRPPPAGTPFALVNHYGPSENSVVATCAAVPAGEERGLPPSIGGPIDNVRVYLVDARSHLVPAGTAGEILLGGAGLARGYLGRPDLTADRFVPDPFAPAPGARLYRTGDLARWRGAGEEGGLQFLGRRDRQVKIRGVRIELGEIEACLARCPGVRQAAVLALRGALVAWVAPEAAPDGAAVRAFLRERLPAALVPADVVRLAALPLTANGKIDRQALPVPEPTAETAREAAAPASGDEIRDLLLGIWRQVLGRRSVGPRDDFFALGGHSLLAAQVLSRLQAVFGVELPLRSLFESPTVAGLAARVEAARAGDAAVRLPPLTAAGPGGPIPLSLTQQGLWFLSRLEAQSGVYNIPSALRLRGDLDAGALALAVRDLVRRHPALRTTLHPGEDGLPCQVIADEPRLELAVTDLRSSPEAAAERIAAEVRLPFDLEQGPLVRAVLLRTGEREHLFVLTVHHAVADGWSMGVLHRDLAACHAARRAGGEPVWKERKERSAPRLTYADFAVWQQRCAAAGWIDPQIAFWRQWLTGELLTPLEIPADRPLPPVRGDRSHHGTTLRTVAPPALAEALRDLGSREAVTLQMVLRAGLEALLFRMTGRERFVVGSPVAGRNRPELEDLAGFFVHMLPVPADLSGRPAVRALLARVRGAALAAYDHQDVSFERLVEALRPPREEGRNPLFEVVLAGNPPFTPPALPGVETERLDVDTGTAKFDLTLFVEERADRAGAIDAIDAIELALEADAERFEAATCHRFVDHLLVLLEGAVADPGAAVSELPLLRAAERGQLLAAWGRIESSVSCERRVHELFEERCAAHPAAVALVTDGGTVTYGELNRRANRLAHCLRRLGVGTDQPVGLCAERSPALIAGLLGILKAGGAYVPLDPAYPAERLAFMTEDAGLSILVGTRSALAGLPALGAREVHLDLAGEAADLAAECGDNPAPAALPGSLAYILFTSGSTGRPKGVGVPHRAVVRLVRGTSFADFSPEQVFLQYAPVSFDLSTLEVWGPLLNGARLVLPPAGRLSLEELGAVLRRHRVSFLWLTAGLFHLMVDEQLDSLRGVRQLIAGGDVLSVPHVERTLAVLDGTFINGYGPTENTTFTACHALRGPAALGASVPIGRPIAGTSVVVVDADLGLLPQGVPGELLTGGDGLARGYFGRPALTAERFVPDPFAPQPGARLYRTGDLARWLPGGILEFLGRRDQQVKIRGFRIEPGEIETALGMHPAVRESVVVAREGGGGKRLVAYVVSADGTDVADAAGSAGLRAFLAERLPEHMIPSAFVVLAALPLSPNGKVDRAALPLPEARRDDSFALPRTPLEAVLADLWAEVLDLETVGIHDLGGHSLLATRLISRVVQVLRAEVSLRVLFRRPTVAGLAEGLTADPAQRARVERVAELLAGLPDEDDEEDDEDDEGDEEGEAAVEAEAPAAQGVAP
jgi:amino acid adenylation domain-containing protein